MRKWEYFISECGRKPATEQVVTDANKLGAEGWELVSVDEKSRYIFKRPVSL